MGRSTSRGRATERIVEIPWTLNHVGTEPVLDIGSCGAEYIKDLPKGSVASDFRDQDELDLPEGITFIKADAQDLPYEDDTWSQITCISTIEHIGCYSAHYKTSHDPEARDRALKEMMRVLKPGGTLLLTVPYGRGEDLGWQIVFDKNSLDDLLDGLNIIEMTFYRALGDHFYLQCLQESLVDVPYQYEDEGARADGVACIVIQKGE